MSKPLHIAIVIPCFNEQDNILNLQREIVEGSYPSHWHITPLFVNDCSTDNSKELLDTHRLHHVDLPVNLGIGGAVQTGYKYAFRQGYDIAVQMDGDGQHPPAELIRLLQPIIHDEADVSIGSRFLTREGFQSSGLRRTGIRFFRWLNERLVGVTIHDSTSGYRALNRKALEVVNAYYPDEYPEPEAIVLYAIHQLRLKEVPVSMRERQGGQSSIRAHKTIYYMIKVCLGTIFLYLRLRHGKRHSV